MLLPTMLSLNAHANFAKVFTRFLKSKRIRQSFKGKCSINLRLKVHAFQGTDKVPLVFVAPHNYAS